MIDEIQVCEFNYQHIIPGGATVTCIVPSAWLALPLPTFGGLVNYIDHHSPLCSEPDFVFEFCEGSEAVILTVYQQPQSMDSGYISIFDYSTQISFEVDEHRARREVLLLNHIFGSLALSASMGNIYLDFGEVARWIAGCRELKLAFGIGSTPEDIFPQLRGYFPDEGSACTFAMLFCREDTMRLDYLSMVSKRFTRGGPSLLSDAAINTGQMLISVLASKPKC